MTATKSKTPVTDAAVSQPAQYPTIQQLAENPDDHGALYFALVTLIRPLHALTRAFYEAETSRSAYSGEYQDRAGDVARAIAGILPQIEFTGWNFPVTSAQIERVITDIYIDLAGAAVLAEHVAADRTESDPRVKQGWLGGTLWRMIDASWKRLRDEHAEDWARAGQESPSNPTPVQAKPDPISEGLQQYVVVMAALALRYHEQLDLPENDTDAQTRAKTDRFRRDALTAAMTAAENAQELIYRRRSDTDTTSLMKAADVRDECHAIAAGLIVAGMDANALAQALSGAVPVNTVETDYLPHVLGASAASAARRLGERFGQ